MAGFGIGFGAFAQGLTGGLQTGLKLGKQFKEAKIQNANEAAIKDAKVDYDKQIADNVLTQAGQAPGIGEPFDVDAANAKAKESVGSFTDFLYQKKMPQIIDTLVQNGDIAGAEKMRKWADDGKERKFMENFGKVLGGWAAGRSSGDYTPFADQAVKLLNSGNYGITADGYDFVKDGDGNTTGLTFNLKDKDGKTFAHTFNSIDDAAQFIAAQGSPTSRFKQWQAEQDAAIKLKTKQGEAAIGLGKDVAVEGVKQKGRLELQDRKADDQLRLEATKNKSGTIKDQQTDDYVMGLLKARGFGDEEVNRYITQKYLPGFRKAKSPQEYAQQIVLELSKDPMIEDKSPEGIRKQAQALMDIARELGADGSTPAARAPAASPRNLPIFR